MKALVFLIDGINPSQMQRSMPFLAAFGKANSFARVVSLLGYSSGIHPTIWTGKYQEDHGLFTTFYYDPHRSPFKWTKWLRVIPTHTARKNFIAALKAPYFLTPQLRPILPRFIKKKIVPLPPAIPADVAPYFANNEQEVTHETIFTLLKKRGITFSKQSDAEGYFGGFRRLDDMTVTHHDVDFYYMYYGDELGHQHGPDSSRVAAYLAKADAVIKRLYETARARGPVQLIVFSDHGMCAVKKYVNVQSVIRAAGITQGREYLAFYDATMVRLWPRTGQAKQVLLEALRNLKGITYLDEGLLKKYHINFTDRKKYGELIFLADPETRIYPDYFAPIKGGLKGWHGFDPAFPDSKGILVTSLPVRKNEIGIIELFPLLKKALVTNISRGARSGTRQRASSARPRPGARRRSQHRRGRAA